MPIWMEYRISNDRNMMDDVDEAIGKTRANATMRGKVGEARRMLPHKPVDASCGISDAEAVSRKRVASPGADSCERAAFITDNDVHSAGAEGASPAGEGVRRSADEQGDGFGRGRRGSHHR